MANHIPDPMLLQAVVVDLEQQVNTLRQQIQGNAPVTFSPQRLIRMYFDACRGPVLDEISARNWMNLILCLDVKQLLVLSRLTQDPFPWQPFIYLLDLYKAQGFDDYVEEALAHLTKTAQGLLNAQGLKKIQPRDVMANPLQIKRAATAIRQQRTHGATRKAKGSLSLQT